MKYCHVQTNIKTLCKQVNSKQLLQQDRENMKKRDYYIYK